MPPIICLLNFKWAKPCLTFGWFWHANYNDALPWSVFILQFFDGHLKVDCPFKSISGDNWEEEVSTYYLNNNSEVKLLNNGGNKSKSQLHKTKLEYLKLADFVLTMQVQG